MNLEEGYHALREHAAMVANSEVRFRPYMPPEIGQFFTVPKAGRKLVLDYDPRQLEGIIAVTKSRSRNWEALEHQGFGSEEAIIQDLKKIVHSAFVEAIRDAYSGETNILAGIMVAEMRNN